MLVLAVQLRFVSLSTHTEDDSTKYMSSTANCPPIYISFAYVFNQSGPRLGDTGLATTEVLTVTVIMESKFSPEQFQIVCLTHHSHRQGHVVGSFAVPITMQLFNIIKSPHSPQIQKPLNSRVDKKSCCLILKSI